LLLSSCSLNDMFLQQQRNDYVTKYDRNICGFLIT
jgi:hypothetical protein